jgi:hypothetical protein
LDVDWFWAAHCAGSCVCPGKKFKDIGQELQRAGEQWKVKD